MDVNSSPNLNEIDLELRGNKTGLPSGMNTSRSGRNGQTAQQSNFVGETVDAKGIEVQRRFTAFLNEWVIGGPVRIALTLF